MEVRSYSSWKRAGSWLLHRVATRQSWLAVRVRLFGVNVERLCLGYLDLIAVFEKAGKRSLLLRRSADAPIRISR